MKIDECIRSKATAVTVIFVSLLADYIINFGLSHVLHFLRGAFVADFLILQTFPIFLSTAVFVVRVSMLYCLLMSHEFPGLAQQQVFAKAMLVVIHY